MLDVFDIDLTSFRALLNKVFNGKIPDYCMKFEARYEDYVDKTTEMQKLLADNAKLITQVKEAGRQIRKNNKIILQKNKQIKKIRPRIWTIAFHQAILLEASERFNVHFSRSFLRRLFSTTKFTLLEQAYDYLQTCSSFEDFERELDRILNNYDDMMKLFRSLEAAKKQREQSQK